MFLQFMISIFSYFPKHCSNKYAYFEYMSLVGDLMMEGLKQSLNGMCQLVNPETGEVIKEPNVSGELWFNGQIFSHYYNNTEQTAEEWYKTGDIMYMDEDGYYFYVDRLNMLIKYRNIHVIPTEIEAVILEIDGVADAVVASKHPEDGEHPVACVVRADGSNISAQDIKDYVAEKLSVDKHLQGVVFVDKIPYLPSGKATSKVRQLISTYNTQKPYLTRN